MVLTERDSGVWREERGVTPALNVVGTLYFITLHWVLDTPLIMSALLYYWLLLACHFFIEYFNIFCIGVIREPLNCDTSNQHSLIDLLNIPYRKPKICAIHEWTFIPVLAYLHALIHKRGRIKTSRSQIDTKRIHPWGCDVLLRTTLCNVKWHINLTAREA